MRDSSDVPANGSSKFSEAVALAGEFAKIKSCAVSIEVIRQGEAVDDVCLIHSGVMKLTWADSRGRESIVGLRWPCGFVGAEACLLGVPSPVSAITLTPSKLERISAETFVRAIQSNPTFAWHVHQRHSTEIIQQFQTLGELACLTAHRRLKRFLSQLFLALGEQAYSADGRLTLPLKRKDFAALLGITPEHLSRILAELYADNTLEKSEWIKVRDFDRLEHDSGAA